MLTSSTWKRSRSSDVWSHIGLLQSTPVQYDALYHHAWVATGEGKGTPLFQAVYGEGESGFHTILQHMVFPFLGKFLWQIVGYLDRCSVHGNAVACASSLVDGEERKRVDVYRHRVCVYLWQLVFHAGGRR